MCRSLFAVILALALALSSQAEGKACTSNSDCAANECCQGVGDHNPVANGNVPSSGNVGFTMGECERRPSSGGSCIKEYGSAKFGGDTSDIYPQCPCSTDYCVGNAPKGAMGTPGMCTSF